MGSHSRGRLHLFLFATVLTAALASARVLAEEAPLSQLALFNRCYQHLTQHRPAPTSPLRQSVASGALSAVDACMQVLDSARFGANGTINTAVPEASDVLRTFNDLHRSFFGNDDIHAALPVGDYITNEARMHDQQEPGLHFTRALFTNGVTVSQVVTGTSALEALRTSGQEIDSTWTSATGPTTTTLLNAPMVQIGNLLGVRTIDSNPAKRDLVVNMFPAVGSPMSGVFLGSIRVNESAGGGVIGTKSYMLLNFARQDMKTMDGGLRMPRVWAKAVFKDLFCRDVPVLRPSDGALYVQPAATGRPPFRAGASCMSCHASMDGMAATVRNYSESIAPQIDASVMTATSLQMAKWTPTLPREVGLVDSDANYHLRPPVGRLVYRDYMGALVNKEVSGAAGVGQAIADGEDFYVCTAARYLEFFTGIQVPLQDPGGPTARKLSVEEQAYYDRTVTLGKALKQHQSLRTLVEQILQLDLYRVPSMRLWGISR